MPSRKLREQEGTRKGQPRSLSLSKGSHQLLQNAELHSARQCALRYASSGLLSGNRLGISVKIISNYLFKTLVETLHETSIRSAIINGRKASLEVVRRCYDDDAAEPICSPLVALRRRSRSGNSRLVLRGPHPVGRHPLDHVGGILSVTRPQLAAGGRLAIRQVPGRQ